MKDTKELKLNQFEELNFDEMQQVSGGCGDWWKDFWNFIWKCLWGDAADQHRRRTGW